MNLLDAIVVGYQSLFNFPNWASQTANFTPRCTPNASCPPSRTRIPALPFCHYTLKGPRPKPNEDPKQLKTLGDHVRRRRLDLELYQNEAALRIGVDKTTICLWETNHATPSVRNMPGVIQFLGYTPHRRIANFGDWLNMVRTSSGLSEETLAEQLGIDESTVANWERGWRQPTARLLTRVKQFFGALPRL